MQHQENKRTNSKTIFYPASYLVMTVTSLLLLVAVIGLGATLIDYWLNGVSSLLHDMFILYWIGSLAVVAPIHLLAYRQVRNTDLNQVTTFSLRFAHGLLGGYLFITVGTIISSSTWLIAIWLNTFLGTGEVDRRLLASSLSLLYAITMLAYVTWHFMRSRANQSRPKYYMIVISILAIIVLTLSIVFPATAYRDVARDFVKETELGQINQAIGEYVDTHNSLPTELNKVSGLSDGVTRHIANYQYTAQGGTKFGIFGYTLCASFARSNDKGHDTGFNFSSHSAGKQCFVRTSISFTKLNQDLSRYIKNDVTTFQAGVRNFLLAAKTTVDQEVSGIEKFAGSEVSGVEGFAGGEIKQLETNLEGVGGGMTELQKEMERLEGNLTGLQGNTGDLAKDFAEVEAFLHDLGCIFGGCKA